MNESFTAPDAMKGSFMTSGRQPLAVSPWRLQRAVQPSGLTWTTSRRAQNVQ
jgi:hypothetical protein